jgi:hypothetical protein
MSNVKAPKMIYDGDNWHMDFESYDPRQYPREKPNQYEQLRKALEDRQITVGYGKTKSRVNPGDGELLKVVYVNQISPLSNTHLALCPPFTTEESLHYRDGHYELKTPSILFRFAPGMFTKYYTLNFITHVYHKRDTTMNDLFTIIDGEHKGKFVTKIGMTGAGQHVVEVRGSGEVFAVSGTVLEKVMPYTVNVRYVGTNPKIYSFFANKDDVAVGDVIIGEAYATPMIVKAIDTKSSTATAWLEGVALKAAKVLEAPKDN